MTLVHYRKYLLLQVLALLLITALAPLTAQEQGQNENHAYLTVGTLFPLSGSLAVYGIAMKNGMEMALDDFPAARKTLKILYEDTRYDQVVTISAFQKLMSQGQANLLFGFGTGPAEAVGSIAEARKMPTFFISTSREYAKGKRFVTRFSFSSSRYSELLLRYLKSKGLKSISLVATESAFVRDVIKTLEALTSQEGIELKAHAVTPADNDFHAIAMAIQHEHPDALGAFLFPGQISAFLRQAQPTLGKLPLLGLNMFEDRAELARSSGSLEGGVYPSVAVSKDFRDRYSRRFGNDEQVAFAAMAYDFVLVALRIAERVGTAPYTAETIAQSLEGLGSIQGMTGSLRYQYTQDEGGTFSFDSVLRIIQGNEFLDLQLPE